MTRNTGHGQDFGAGERPGITSIDELREGRTAEEMLKAVAQYRCVLTIMGPHGNHGRLGIAGGVRSQPGLAPGRNDRGGRDPASRAVRVPRCAYVGLNQCIGPTPPAEDLVAAQVDAAELKEPAVAATVETTLDHRQFASHPFHGITQLTT